MQSQTGSITKIEVFLDDSVRKNLDAIATLNELSSEKFVSLLINSEIKRVKMEFEGIKSF